VFGVGFEKLNFSVVLQCGWGEWLLRWPVPVSGAGDDPPVRGRKRGCQSGQRSTGKGTVSGDRTGFPVCSLRTQQRVCLASVCGPDAFWPCCGVGECWWFL